MKISERNRFLLTLYRERREHHPKELLYQHMRIIVDAIKKDNIDVEHAVHLANAKIPLPRHPSHKISIFI